MPEVICDVSPIQYLHQAGLLDLLRLRYGAITIPTAVAAELREGTLRGVDLPAFEALDWIQNPAACGPAAPSDRRRPGGWREGGPGPRDGDAGLPRHPR